MQELEDKIINKRKTVKQGVKKRANKKDDYDIAFESLENMGFKPMDDLKFAKVGIITIALLPLFICFVIGLYFG